MGTDSRERFQLRALREKRGSSLLPEYQPWRQVRRGEPGSRGRSHVTPPLFDKCQHHLMSDLEWHVFLLLNWAKPLSVKEHYPLLQHGCKVEFAEVSPGPKGSVDVARSLGVRHPTIGKQVAVLTSTFLVRARDGTCISIQTSHGKENSGRRPSSRSRIAAEYWRQRQVANAFVSRRDLPESVLIWLVINWLTDGRLKASSGSIVGIMSLAVPALVGTGYATAGLLLLMKRAEVMHALIYLGLISLVALPAYPVNALAFLPYTLGAAAAKAAASGVAISESVYWLIAANSVGYLVVGIGIFQFLQRRARNLGVLGHCEQGLQWGVK